MIASKKESAPAKKRSLQKLCQLSLLIAQYYAAAFCAKMFEQPFWYWQRRKALIWDRLANEGIEL